MPKLFDPPAGRPVVAVVAGSGQTAGAAADAGADLLVALNAGVYRALGVGSLASFLPYGNANAQTERLVRTEVLPRAGRVPVVAGVFAADPTLDLPAHLDRLRALGVRGATNWPSLGFVDGQFREALEEEGFDPASELRLLTAARAAGLAAVGFAHAEADAARFAPLSDALILNVGLTHEIDDRHDRRDRLQAVAVRLNRMLAAVRAGARRPPPCLLFGGPVTTADDFQAVARQCPIDGFAGGSVFDRLPVRRAVGATVRQFLGVAADRPAPDRLGGLVGGSPPMRALFETVRRVARYDVNVCVEGGTGTGKELVATQLHRLSPRAAEPFVTLNCGAIPEALVESELFGYERGAFTGADRRRPGKFELADRGTLFLDEVADLGPRAQVALLRVLQQGEVVRVGGDAPVRVDVRVVTATHQSLPRLVAAGRFRADLLYRLDQVTVRVPALADRKEDIPLLVADILGRLRGRLGRNLTGVTAGFRARLLAHDWPGNVRELEHVVCRAAILEDGDVLDGPSFAPGRGGVTSAADAVRAAGGNKSRAAESLGVSRKTLYKRLRLGT